MIKGANVRISAELSPVVAGCARAIVRSRVEVGCGIGDE